MNPTQALQYCIDNFSRQMFSDKLAMMYEALEQSKELEKEIKKAMVWTLENCDTPHKGSINDFLNNYFNQ